MQDNNLEIKGRFTKGKSGNPAGRPKKDSKLLRKALEGAKEENGDTSFYEHIAKRAYESDDIAIEVLRRLIPVSV